MAVEEGVSSEGLAAMNDWVTELSLPVCAVLAYIGGLTVLDVLGGLGSRKERRFYGRH